MRGKPLGWDSSSKTAVDHPRGCGENLRHCQAQRICLGSPPRMRGKLRLDPARVQVVRITPADAGKTDSRVKMHGDEEDHPRGCGENLQARRDPQSLPGSPPRMRGKRFGVLQRAHDFGITPADAGKTSFNTCPRLTDWDHPRGCGENRHAQIACEDGSGITPADAGKTPSAKAVHDALRDHPRGCGENARRTDRQRMSPGSPPRMRGKPRLTDVRILPGRITPADAGKTRLIRMPFCQLWDHPRGCGENCVCTCSRLRGEGSPPRMRGKPPYANAGNYTIGITPADAGKTRHPQRSRQS